MRILLPCAWLIGLVPLALHAQTGPGGVGSSSSNVLWLSADNGITSSGGLVTAWSDRSGKANNAAPPASAARPALIASGQNGLPVLRFDGSDDELRVPDANSLDLTAWHFFTVVRTITAKDYNAWLTKGDDGSENYEILSYADGNVHMPVLWTDNVRTFNSTAAGQTGSSFHIIEYSYKSGGRAEYTDGAAIYTDTETRTPKTNAMAVYIGNEKGTSGRFMAGEMAETIAYNAVLNSAQRIIVDNYLAAKYGLTLGASDLYVQDNTANGNFDFEVAGIGRIDNSNKQLDSRGSSVLRIVSSGSATLADNEFMLWGHNNKPLGTGWTNDFPAGLQGRWDRVWRVSEVTTSGAAADIGAVDLYFDLNGLGSISTNNIRLLVDADNDGVFSDETAIGPPTAQGGGIYKFTGVTALANGLRFTLGTTNRANTPLPIELLSFAVSPAGPDATQVQWSTASEQDNAFFTIERSIDTAIWDAIASLPGAGNSSSVINYAWTDAAPLSGTSYYRLKQTDSDGSATVSDIVPITRGNSALLVFPNPAQGHVIVRADMPDGPLSLIDGLGRAVGRGAWIRNGTAEMDLAGLPPGLYHLRSGSDPRAIAALLVE